MARASKTEDSKQQNQGGIYTQTTIEHATQLALQLSRILYKSALFSQNKPNFQNAQMNASSVLTKDYENQPLRRLPENKANQTQCRNSSEFNGRSKNAEIRWNYLQFRSRAKNCRIFTHISLTSLSFVGTLSPLMSSAKLQVRHILFKKIRFLIFLNNRLTIC